MVTQEKSFPPICSLHVSLNSIGICDAVRVVFKFFSEPVSAKDIHSHRNHCIFDNCFKFSLILHPLLNWGLARWICYLFPYAHCNYPCFNSFGMDYLVFFGKNQNVKTTWKLRLHTTVTSYCIFILSLLVFAKMPWLLAYFQVQFKVLVLTKKTFSSWFLGIRYKNFLLNGKILKGMSVKWKTLNL